jgi:hypothetical protein
MKFRQNLLQTIDQYRISLAFIKIISSFQCFGADLKRTIFFYESNWFEMHHLRNEMTISADRYFVSKLNYVLLFVKKFKKTLVHAICFSFIDLGKLDPIEIIFKLLQTI